MVQGGLVGETKKEIRYVSAADTVGAGELEPERLRANTWSTEYLGGIGPRCAERVEVLLSHSVVGSGREFGHGVESRAGRWLS